MLKARQRKKVESIPDMTQPGVEPGSSAVISPNNLDTESRCTTGSCLRYFGSSITSVESENELCKKAKSRQIHAKTQPGFEPVVCYNFRVEIADI
jgi:hypothetical protein